MSRGKLDLLANLLDRHFRVWGIRFGWDSILGLIPVVGDLTTNLLSLYIVFQAVLLGAPATVILRMLGNILVDNLIDCFPLVGNLADFFWQANVRNIDLLNSWLDSPNRTESSSRFLLIAGLFGVTGFFVALAVFTATLLYAALGWFIGLIS
jgi:ABC-type antimicrobial peptide transport system permease subunit